MAVREHSTPEDHPNKAWSKLEAYSPRKGVRQRFRVIGNRSGGPEPSVLHDPTVTPVSIPSAAYKANYDQVFGKRKR